MTRDRKAVEVEWRGVAFDVVDTGGWLAAGDALEEKVSEQAEAALAEADLVLLVVDGATGPVEEDAHAARWVLRSGRPVLLVVNKVDDAAARGRRAGSSSRLGVGEPDHGERPARPRRGRPARSRSSISSANDRGRRATSSVDDDGALRVAIVGRPNVGKSTLFNQLIGEERSVVHDLPGTTRDAIDTVVETEAGRGPLHRHRGHAPARARPKPGSRPTRSCAASTRSTARTSRSW